MQKRDWNRLDELENAERERVRQLFLRGELNYLTDEGQRELKEDLPKSRVYSNSAHGSRRFRTPTRSVRTTIRPSTKGTHETKTGATNVEKLNATQHGRRTGTTSTGYAIRPPIETKFPFISTLRTGHGIGSRSISMGELFTPTSTNFTIEKMSNESEFGGASESEEKVSMPTNLSESSNHNQSLKESKWTKFPHLQKLLQIEVCYLNTRYDLTFN